MPQRDIPGENAHQAPIPQFSHDPDFIAFRSWTAILSLEGKIPGEVRPNETFLFLDENPEAYGTERVPVKEPVCLRNPSRFSQLNVTIVGSRSGQEVFSVRELPAGRFLHLEFLQKGSYILHYSPAFSDVTLRRNIQAFISPQATAAVPDNFKPSLQNTHPKSTFNTPFVRKLQTSRAKVTFNSPFSEYKG